MHRMVWESTLGISRFGENKESCYVHHECYESRVHCVVVLVLRTGPRQVLSIMLQVGKLRRRCLISWVRSISCTFVPTAEIMWGPSGLIE
jgi:hypothetical protein